MKAPKSPAQPVVCSADMRRIIFRAIREYVVQATCASKKRISPSLNDIVSMTASEPWLMTSRAPRKDKTMPPQASKLSRSRTKMTAMNAVIAGLAAAISVQFVTVEMASPVNCMTLLRPMPVAPMRMSPRTQSRGGSRCSPR